jgi:glutamine amidotransferase
MWMHNGVIAAFNLIKRRLMTLLSDELYLHIQGTTDSEAIFMLFLNLLQKKYPDANLRQAPVDPFVLKTVMEETIQTLLNWKEELKIQETSHMNFAVSDGNCIIVTRFTHPSDVTACSLYFASGTQFAVGKDNDYEMLQTDRRQMCHIIASEPLSKSVKDWISVPREHLVMVTKDSSLLLFPISASPQETAQIN